MSAYVHHSAEEENAYNYLKRLTQAPLLTKAEEEFLARQVQKGDGAAKKRLIEANMRLVISVARSYRSSTLPLEDLISEGAVGLIQAAERFDPSRGFRFTTYAMHWIRQSITRAVDCKAKAIRLPAHVIQSIRKVDKARESIIRETGQEPSSDQLARAVGICPQKLGQLLQASQDLISLDMQVGESGGTALGNLIRDPHQPGHEPSTFNDERLEVLNDLIKELSFKEQQVVKMKLQGNTDGEPSDIDSADKLAQELQLSRERVRQIEVLAIRKLRVLAARRLAARADSTASENKGPSN